jgi:hypothetical protein
VELFCTQHFGFLKKLLFKDLKSMFFGCLAVVLHSTFWILEKIFILRFNKYVFLLFPDEGRTSHELLQIY